MKDEFFSKKRMVMSKKCTEAIKLIDKALLPEPWNTHVGKMLYEKLCSSCWNWSDEEVNDLYEEFGDD